MQKKEHAKGEKKRGQRQNIYQVDSLQVMIAVYSEIDNLCVVYNLISSTNPKKNEVGTEYKNISIFFPSCILSKKNFLSFIFLLLLFRTPRYVIFRNTSLPYIKFSLRSHPPSHAQRRRENARIGRANYHQQLSPSPVFFDPLFRDEGTGTRSPGPSRII